MKKMLYVSGILLVVAAGVLVVALKTSRDKSKPSAAPEQEKFEQTVANLYGRLHQVERERDLAHRKITELQDEVAALAEKRSGDKRVIEDLWRMLVAATSRERKAEEKGPEAAPPIDGQKEVPADDRNRKAKYDAEAVKKMLASLGGNLDAAVHQMVTTEGIDRILQEHADQAAYWTAAASLASDPNAARVYLEEAAQLYPDSAAVLSALLSAQIAAGTIDESALARAADLQRVDPTNALGDCYAAYCQFQTGDVPGALQSLAQASAKGRFADDRIAMLTARYDYFLNEGASDAVALGMGAFTLPLEHLGMLRQVGQQAVDQVHSLSAASQFDEALKIAQDVSTLGRTVSSSGRFLVHDRVGIAMEQAGLTEQRQIYEAQGDLRQVQTIDAKLQTLQDRSATIDTMAQAFGAVMGSMTDEDLAAYVDSTILNGEFTTLQNLPAIAEALKQTPTVPPGRPAQTPEP
jgi:tetratricopeptide (TPR) repeat protein